MYEFNSLDTSALNNTCCCCLKTSVDVRIMTADEKNTYLNSVKESYLASNLSVCLYCAHMLKKFNKFSLQCHEANLIIQNFLAKGTKLQEHILSPLILCYNLTISGPKTLDVCDNIKDCTTGPLSEDDTVFDDEDIPLVMLKKEEVEPEVKVKKKKKKIKKKHLDVEENQENTITSIKTENQEIEVAEQKNAARKGKSVKKPKKELREGFSSRMVQETEEYVVIKLTKEQVLSEMEERSKSAEYQRTLFKCHKCVKGFNFEDVLRTHMEKHSMENGSFQCEICTQYCPSAVSLRGHMKSHTTRYRCKVCGWSRQARQHVLEHHAQHTRAALRYTCTQCEFVTTKRTSMQRHVKSHSAGERHACHRCGKLFKSLETLRVHTMRHDKSSALSCGACGRTFVYPSLLHAHVQAVHVRKDYYCVECDAEFKSRENLRLHFKKAKKHRDASSYQYECKQCPERFTTAAALTGHARSRHGDTPPDLACTACHKTFARKSVLAAHMRIHEQNGAQHKKLEDTLLAEVSQSTLMES